MKFSIPFLATLASTSQLVAASTDQANADQITDLLPGQKEKAPFKHYSGYLPVDDKPNGKKIFYWYFESEQSPENDPVVLWTNGGPGCSGIMGLFTENGPFFPDQEGNLNMNEFSWNKIANVLFVEQPAGVGFSYSEDEADYTTGDDQAAVDNHRLVLEFLERFPERKPNEFYITSESYGGHYMPQLAKEIVDNNADGAINFKGFAVGNPYTNAFTNNVAQYRAYYYNGLVPAPTYKKWNELCASSQADHVKNLQNCTILEGIMNEKMTNGINPYALDYPTCPGGAAIQAAVSPQAQRLQHFSAGVPLSESIPKYDPCVTNYLVDYLNTPAVKEAIHAKADIEWGTCSNIVNYAEKDMERDTAPLYNYLIDGFDLNILVYSGDDDAICAMTGTHEWIWELGYEPKRGQLWNTWMTEVEDYGKQISGYYTHFEAKEGGKHGLSFATVHGAGHEVPTYKPKQALELLGKYLSGEW